MSTVKENYKDAMSDLHALVANTDLEEIFAEAAIIAEATVANLYAETEKKGIPRSQVEMHEKNVFSQAYKVYATERGLEDNALLDYNLQVALSIR